jgi:polyhydroxybutyrate depolymerase
MKLARAMAYARLLLAAAVALTVALCLASPARASVSCAPAAARTFTLTLESGRTALVHVPSRRGPAPVVLAFHGAGGSGRFMASYSGLARLADRERFVAVFPDAMGGTWRLAGSAADVVMTSELLDRLEDTLCVDSSRVYATGVSNGGGMTARLGCEMGERLAAIAPVAGGYRSLAPCGAGRPLAVLEIHGTADGAVPYWGWPDDRRGDVLRYLAGWRQRNHCRGQARRSWARAHVQRLAWSGCASGADVLHLRLLGGAHAWPGSLPREPGPVSGLSAAEEVWRFLRSHHRAA